MLVIYFLSKYSCIHLWNVRKLEKKELPTLNNNINASKTNSIYDEYKSNTSHVIKVLLIHDKEKLTPINEHDYYNITLG